jgi:hypothetical protein
MKRLDLSAIVYEGAGRPTPWVVEAIDDGREGDERAMYMAMFTEARRRADGRGVRAREARHEKKPPGWPESRT